MTGHAVRRLPVDTGVSGWGAICQRGFPVRTLDEDIRCDWLIIGAGFAGLSAARRLARTRPGERIVVLEARDLAEGPAGRNSGFMIDVPHNLASGDYSVGDRAGTLSEIEENRLAIAFARDAAEEYGLDRETFDPCGKVNAAASERGLKLNEKFAVSLAAIGEPSETIDARALKELTGSDYYLGGLYTPGCVLIQPVAYIRAVAAGLAPRVDIRERSPVTRLERSGRDWVATAARNRVTAHKVILGVNGHVEDFGHFEGRLIHIFTYASMTAALPDDRVATGAARWALLPADPMGATLRKVSDKRSSRIVIRTHFTYDPSLRVSEDRVKMIAGTQRRSFDARFPALQDVPFECSWAGRLCLSRNQVPAFGEVEENLYSACCGNGLGTVKSTLAGMMAADLAAGMASDALSRYQAQQQPARLPPRLATWLGVNSTIRWQRLRAGREG